MKPRTYLVAALSFGAALTLAGCEKRPYVYVFAPADGALCGPRATPRLEALVYLDGWGPPSTILDEDVLRVTMTIDANAPMVLDPDQFGYLSEDLPVDPGQHHVRLATAHGNHSFRTSFTYTKEEEEDTGAIAATTTSTQCVAPTTAEASAEGDPDPETDTDTDTDTDSPGN